MGVLHELPGPKKITDYNIGENGQHYYKVEWGSTWELAENLTAFQHLMDEFWLCVTLAKTQQMLGEDFDVKPLNPLEELSLQEHIVPCQDDDRGALSQEDGMGGFETLSQKDKSEVNELIERCSSLRELTIPTYKMSHDFPLMCSSYPTSSLQQTPPTPSLISLPLTPRHTPHKTLVGTPHKSLSTPTSSKSPGNIFFSNYNIKSEYNDSSNNNKFDEEFYSLLTSGSANTCNGASPQGKDALTVGSPGAILKYVQDFDHPYVKLLIVCKFCNKLSSMRQTSCWKQHFTFVHSMQTPQQLQQLAMSSTFKSPRKRRRKVTEATKKPEILGQDAAMKLEILGPDGAKNLDTLFPEGTKKPEILGSDGMKTPNVPGQVEEMQGALENTCTSEVLKGIPPAVAVSYNFKQAK